MAITIPEVKRFDPQDAPVLPGLNARPPDATAAVEKVGKATEGIAEQSIKLRNNIADQAADTAATDATNKFEQRWKSAMYGNPETGTVGLKYQTGNPTDLYQAFDKQMQGHLDDLSQNPDWDTETQKLVNRRLSKKAEQLNGETLVEYGGQAQKYDKGVDDARIKLDQQGMASASSFVVPGDDASFNAVNARLNSIKNTVIRGAVRTNPNLENEDGLDSYQRADGTRAGVSLDPQTQLQIAKSQSDALVPTIKNLVDSGVIDKAQAMQEKYKDMIDPLSKDLIGKKFQDAKVSAEAFKIAGDARVGGDPESALKNASSEEVYHKAIGYIKDDQAHMQAIKAASSKTNYGTLMNHITDVAQNGGGWTGGKTQLEGDPYFQKTIDNITDPKQKAAIYAAVEQPPKVSDPKSTLNMMHIISGDPASGHPNGLVGMAPEDFQLAIAGANKADRTRYTNLWTQINKTQNGQQMAQTLSHAMAETKDQAMTMGFVKADNSDGTSFVKGGKNDALLSQIKDQVTSAIVARGNLSVPDMRTAVHDALVQYAQNKPVVIPRLQATGSAFGDGGNTGSTPNAGEVRKAAFKDFVADPKNKGMEPTNKQLDAYIQSNPKYTKAQ